MIKAAIVMITCMSLCSCHFRYGRLDVVQYMVTKTNCDVNAKNEDGGTPLDVAQLLQ